MDFGKWGSIDFNGITKTRLAILSFLLGFSCGIIATGCYMFVSIASNSTSVFDLF